MKWSDNEIRLLTEVYPETEMGELLPLFPGRTAKDIRMQASRLGVRKAGRKAVTERACWTEEEVLRLERMYSSAAWSELEAAFPMHTAKSIGAKAVKLGLHRDSPVGRDRAESAWSPDEETMLSGMYPCVPEDGILAAFPGRTWGAIRAKAMKLGLRRAVRGPGRGRWTETEIANLRYMYAVSDTSSEVLAAAFPGRSLCSVRAKASKLGICAERDGSVLAASRMGRNDVWSDCELEVLVTAYAGGADRASVLEKLPGRTWNGVCKKAGKLGLSRPAAAMAVRRPDAWSEDELGLLREGCLAGRTTLELMRVLPGRTRRSILNKIEKLGLGRPGAVPWSDAERQVLIDNWSVGTKQSIAGLLPGRSWSAIVSMAYKLGLKSAVRVPRESSFYLDDSGYVHIYRPGYHRSDGRGFVLEHIYVFETATGIHVPDTCLVHHLDENKTNNDISNLCMMEKGAHTRMHMRGNGLVGAKSRKAVDLDYIDAQRAAGRVLDDICVEVGIYPSLYYVRKRERDAALGSGSRDDASNLVTVDDLS